MRKLLIYWLVSTTLMFSGCSLNELPFVHRIDVQQGNIITQEMVDQLHLGMEKSQVRFVLGTPLLVDVFHQDRWDYFYGLQEGNGTYQQHRVSLFFEAGQLARIDGDYQPNQQTKDRQPKKDESVIVVPPAAEESGVFKW